MRFRRDESGAVLVFTAVVLVVMLGIAALVVDLGIAYGHRRSMQSAADASALGAAQDLARADSSSATSTATALGDENLPRLTIMWNGCAGDTLPSGFQIAGPGPQLRVVRPLVRTGPRAHPPAVVPEPLRRRQSLSTSTVAIAGLHGVGNGGGLLPFAMNGSFGSATTASTRAATATASRRATARRPGTSASSTSPAA